MKKFNATKMMALLMALCLITSTFVGSTLAKYTTEATGTDTARVAKFGVEVTANGETFATAYDSDTDPSVKSQTTLNVVAPGTEGSLASMGITGTPEVDVNVTYTGAFDIDDSFWMVDGVYYCPLIIEVEDNAIDGKSFTSATAFETAVNDAIADVSADYEQGTDLSTVDVVDIDWEWPFYVSDANDAKDTKLGDKAVAADDTVNTVTLAITTTVTQID